MKWSNGLRIKGTLLPVVGILSSGRNANARLLFVIAIHLGLVGSGIAAPELLPKAYDLRTEGYVTSVKNQQGGTCWCHGIMAAIESNLLITGVWQASDQSGSPNLAEYHLDWWNGFNQHNNDDLVPSSAEGLVVHGGGNYLIASAYIARGEGAVSYAMANDSNEYDDPWYFQTPSRRNPSYTIYYARDIEWYTAGANLSNIDTIKRVIMNHGAIATCVCYGNSLDPNLGGTAYQPPTNEGIPDHSVAIIGWDDEKLTQAPKKGAWLAKNSYGSDWNEDGYYWISYYDKHCAQDPEMGAVSFQNVEHLVHDHIYYHDYHGWRDTKADCDTAFNAFVAGGTEHIEAVSFYSTTENITYVVKIYDRFEDGILLDELAMKSGHITHTGFHTVDLDMPVTVVKGDDFYVYLKLSAGGHAYDRTSELKVLLGETISTKMNTEGGSGIWVESVSHPNESYYLDDTTWRDLHDVDVTANFCIKALTIDLSPDFNRDKFVNSADFAILARAWKTECGDEAWNLYCDLNLDNVIDSQDLTILTEHWLEDLRAYSYPIVHWPLDEIAGQIAYDSVSHNHAELFGDPQWQPNSGKKEGAIGLDGDDDFIGTEYILDPSDGPFSVFAWIKGGATGQVVISQLWGVNWLMADINQGYLKTELREPTHTAKPLVSEVSITDGLWHHIGLIWDGMNRILYVDENMVATDTQQDLARSIEGLNIGCGPEMTPGTYWSGLIDDVRIYDRALSADKISTLAQ